LILGVKSAKTLMSCSKIGYFPLAKPPESIDLSLVIACYNEAPHLFANISTLYELLVGLRIRFEFVFIDDASQDSTCREIDRCLVWLKEKNVPTQALFHAKNQGRGATIRDGMKAAKGLLAGFLDIDLEHKPDAIPMLLMRFRNEPCDVIVGRRYFDAAEMHPVRLISHLGYRALVRSFLDLPVGDTESGFKFFRMDTCRAVIANTRDPGWFWDTEIVHYSHAMGLNVVEHPIIFARNPEKKSTVRVFRDSWRMFRALLAYRKRAATPMFQKVNP
jgi:dolichyl-phosphate beta-glucosyltransferase